MQWWQCDGLIKVSGDSQFIRHGIADDFIVHVVVTPIFTQLTRVQKRNMAREIDGEGIFETPEGEEASDFDGTRRKRCEVKRI